MTNHACYVWNANQFGLLVQHTRSWSFFNNCTAGSKKETRRLTFIGCCNSDGSEHFPWMFIGRFWLRCSFCRNSGEELDFNYHAKQKSWMKQVLFYLWLLRLDAYVAKTPVQKLFFCLTTAQSMVGLKCFQTGKILLSHFFSLRQDKFYPTYRRRQTLSKGNYLLNYLTYLEEAIYSFHIVRKSFIRKKVN